MKILVTGATGFIGNHVIQTLLRLNHDIIATSRNMEKARKFSWFDKVTYIPADLNENRENYFHFFEEPEIVIHLTWEGLPNYKDLFHFEKNLMSQYDFLRNLIIHGLKKLCVTGTCFEYGMQNGCLSEEMNTNPVTPYGLAKDCLRKFLEILHQKCNYSLTWIRLFYMYGNGQSEKSLLSQLEAAIQRGDKSFNMSGGEQLRDYLPVEKVAENIVSIVLQDRIQGIINCCSGKPISIRKFVENFLEERQADIRLNLGYYPYPDYEPMAFWGDSRKLSLILKSTLN